MSMPFHRREDIRNPAAGEETLLPALGVTGLLFTPTAIVGAALLYFFLGASPARANDFEAGRKLFIKNKCTQCHAVSALKIAKVEGEADEEEEEEGDEKLDPPDLSRAGLDHPDPKWIARYLKKLEKIEDRRHKKKWKGSEADLALLAEWVASLKHDVPKGKAAPAKK